MPRKRTARNPQVEWTYEMNMFLLNCRDQAKMLVISESPPLKSDGRKMGYMQIMHNLFLERFPELNHLNPQNLRDKIAHAEQSVNIAQTSLTETFNSEVNINVNIVNNENIVNVDTANTEVNDDRADYLLEELNEKECEAFNESLNVFADVHGNVGDMSSRQWSTRVKKVPLENDIKAVNKIVYRLMSLHGLDKLIIECKYFEALWKLDCILYVAITSWYKVNDIKCQNKSNAPKEEGYRPKWLRDMDESILQYRKLISQCVAELDRIKRNGRVTRKTRRNRKHIEAEIGIISVYSLTKYIMKLKAQIHRKARSRKRKLKKQEARYYNNLFQNNQGKVFKDFRAIIDKKKDEEYPTFEKLEKVRKYFPDSAEVIAFWKSLWEKDDEGNPEAEWLQEYNDLFETLIPEVDSNNIVITKQIIWDTIKRKRNWSAPGPDGVVNFWLKKLTVIHDTVCSTFSGILNSECMIEEWYVRGITVLLEKTGEWIASNTRPITCTNNIYKWFSSVLLLFFNNHVKQNNLMQTDQRGAKEKCSGTLQNLLIDNMILNDAHDHKRNLSCGWVDVRKAYDSLSHKWIVKMLEIHRFPKKIANVISKIINTWNTKLVIPLETDNVYSDPIKIKTGVFQGDPMSGNIYTLSKNPVSWELRRFDGYTLSKPIKEKITHSLFIDDLKCYSKSSSEQRKMMSHAKSLMSDAGLEWNVKKTKVLNIKNGKVVTSDENLVLHDGTAVECLKNEEVYKFLGVPESEVHDIEDLMVSLRSKVKERSSVVWSSPLSDHNKVHATNVFVHACAEYFMWSEKIKITDLRELDVIIREVMNTQRAKYKLQINSSLYLPRSMGGRGLKQFEATYKMIKIKSAIKLVTDSEPKMKLVQKFDLLRKQKKRSSLIGDGIRYAADDFNAEFHPEEGGTFNFTYRKNDTVESTTDIVVAGRTLKSEYRRSLLQDLCKSTWQGVIMKQRIDDEELVQGNCFMWMSKWKDCPVDVINDVQSIYLQTVPTLTFQKFRGQSEIISTTCRICNSGNENVRHLLSNCSKFAKTLYIRRHNRALQYILFHVLVMYNLAEKYLPWFSNVVIDPLYENDDITLLWDIPEYTGHEEEEEDRVQRPDGKLILKKEKIIYVLEMSVPWITNRETKEAEKVEKYENIIRTLKLSNPGFHVEQLTFIMDCLGGYSKSLSENLKKLKLTSKTRERVLIGLQKITMSEARALINQFKVLVM